MNILTVNGIESDGSTSTDRMGTIFRGRGYNVIDINQPIRHTWNARWTSDRDAGDIVNIAKDGDVVIAHSYGCLKTAIANRGVKFAAIFLFRPAMGSHYKFPQYQKTKTYCIYSKQDYTILFGSLLRFNHPFGLAGFRGFRSPFVTNKKSKGGHSEDFTKGHIHYWADWIDAELHQLGVVK
jgi:hypothetical protein